MRSVGFLSLFFWGAATDDGHVVPCSVLFICSRSAARVGCTVVHETLSVSHATAFACRRPGGLGSAAPQSPRPTEHCLVNTCTFRLGWSEALFMSLRLHVADRVG